MNTIPTELIINLILLVGLIFLFKLKDMFEAYDRQSYKQIVIGLSVLAICSISTGLNRLDVFQNIQSNGITQILYWFGNITGMLLLLSGVSSWLPVYRKHIIANSQNNNKLELHKKIEQLLLNENQNDKILKQTTDLIVSQYGFTEVSCFVYSQKFKKLSLLTTASNDYYRTDKSDKIKFQNEKIASLVINTNTELSQTITGTISPDLTIPIISNNKLLGAFCIFSIDDIDLESRKNLELIIGLIAKKIYHDSLMLKKKKENTQRNLVQKFADSFKNSNSLKDSIRDIKTTLRNVMSVDYLAISFVYKRQKIKLTLSENNQILENITELQNNSNNLEQYVYDTNISVVIDNVEKETDFILDLHALKSDMKSIVAHPLTHLSQQIGVCVIGSKKYSAFTQSDISFVNNLQHTIISSIENSIDELQNKHEENRSKQLQALLRQATSQMLGNNYYQKITDIISNDLNASSVRISMFDNEQLFLNSIAMTQSKVSESTTPADASMLLSLMPNHRDILYTRKSVIVNSSLVNADEALLEQRQVFGEEYAQYILVPFYSQNIVSGLITIGFKNQKKQIFNSDMVMLENIASALTVHLDFNTLNIISNTKVDKPQVTNYRLLNMKKKKDTTHNELIGIS